MFVAIVRDLIMQLVNLVDAPVILDHDQYIQLISYLQHVLRHGVYIIQSNTYNSNIMRRWQCKY